jgi:excinuclease ABC subunit C
MDLYEKIRTLPTNPGVYLYKNASGVVIYVGKAKNLRARVRSYLLESSQANAKTGSLMREAVDLEYILVGNEIEALALESVLIKEKKPRFNVMLKDDKSYPYVKLTLADRHPKIFVTRKILKDGAAYYGPYFPGSLAYRVVDLIHRKFLLPSCKVDLERYHPRACLEYYIHRCLGPCVEGLTDKDAYAQAVRDAQWVLEGRADELEQQILLRMQKAADDQLFELAARLRDQISTLRQLHDKQRIATTDHDDADVFGYHFEDGMLAVNLFHLRDGKIVDRREFFWDELPEIFEPANSEGETRTGAKENFFDPAPFFSALLSQMYIDARYVPREILAPTDFPERATLSSLLAERTKHRVEIAAPQRGEKRSLVDLACQNARQSHTQRFRVLEPSQKAIQQALADALMLPDLPERIECFDISHIQGAETVASLVVWEKGKMNKQAYRKFKVKTVTGVDDFASMREVVERRYRRLRDEKKSFPSLILIDGGLGQLHSAAQALEALDLGAHGIPLPPLASIAKREEVIYVYGNEQEPVVLERRSPVLHLVQMIRDESHRFAVGYHRQRRAMRDRESELLEIPGIGTQTRARLLTHFGSLKEVKQASADSLSAVLPPKIAHAVWEHFHANQGTN